MTRTWQCSEGDWPPAKVNAFERLMEDASIKRKGEPRLVDAWDDGRSARCWYSARVCLDETALRDKVRAVFGQHERAPEE